MINTKFSKRKLKHYLDNNMDYSNDQAVMNILLGHIIIGDSESATALADYLIENGFAFNKSSNIPSNISYSTGEDPGIMLQFAYALKKLYETTNTTSYQTEYLTILTRLNENMDIGVTGAGLSSYVLLYDANSILVPTFRSGFYTSDASPALWYLLSDYSSNATECINYLKASFEDFASKSGIELGFTPFYNLELPENSSFGSYDAWYFDGYSGDETSFIHQYKTVLNLALYYFEMFRIKGKRDYKIKQILEKFFNYIIARTEIPTSISYETLYAGNENIYAGSTAVYAGQEAVYDIAYGDYNYKFAAILVIAGILKFKVDKDDGVFSYVETIINTLINNQASNGSFSYTSGVEFEAQAYIYLAFCMYESLTKKSYYDIINEAFCLLNLDRINETNYSTHPQNNVLDICAAQINEILIKKHFEFTKTETNLVYSSGVYEYNLDTLKIDPHRIECVGYYDSAGVFYELDEISYIEFLEYRNRDSSANKPLKYALNQNRLYLYNTPDSDYSIKVWHYKLEDTSINYGKIPNLLPSQHSHVLKWAIASEVATNRGNNLKDVFAELAKKSLSSLTYDDTVDASECSQRESAVRW